MLFKIALYYFVFEMNYVALKLESTTDKEYKERERKLNIAKALMIVGMGLIQMPIATVSLVISTVEQYKNLKQYNLALIIVVRVSVLIIDTFMFVKFGFLLKYFIKKREQVKMVKRTSRSYVDTF